MSGGFGHGFEKGIDTSLKARCDPNSQRRYPQYPASCSGENFTDLSRGVLAHSGHRTGPLRWWGYVDDHPVLHAAEVGIAPGRALDIESTFRSPTSPLTHTITANGFAPLAHDD